MIIKRQACWQTLTLILSDNPFINGWENVAKEPIIHYAPQCCFGHFENDQFTFFFYYPLANKFIIILGFPNFEINDIFCQYFPHQPLFNISKHTPNFISTIEAKIHLLQKWILQTVDWKPTHEIFDFYNALSPKKICWLNRWLLTPFLLLSSRIS